MATGTSYRRPGTLPPQTSGFVGREDELARVHGLLQRSRLVTVTGAGGVGKTRLALRAAETAQAGFRDGAAFADLSAVRDPGLLVTALAAALGLAGPATAADAEPGPELGRLLGFLRERQLLLILDTCEHLVDGCAALADVILRAAPGVSILATTRQPLDAAGETALQLAPLTVPEAGAAGAGQAEAVELFAQRAAAAVPGFAVTPDNLADVITVCRRLDGIPLAIELAAVRLRALPLHQMAERIEDRLRLLTGGRRSGPARHQTLRAAVDWSYSLCPPPEQLLWARLSVFAGDFDIAAAEEVGAGGELAPDQVLPAIISLVDKNVLVREDSPGARPAFRMPGTLREFGADRLNAADPQADAVRRRLVARYLTLAERFAQAPGPGQLAQYQRLRREQASLRAAFEYALALPGNDGAAVVLATSLLAYWQISGLLREAEYWLDQVVVRCPGRSAARARVLATRGYIRVLLGDFARGRADAEDAVAMAAVFGDAAAEGRGHSALHRALTFGGNLAEAEQAAGSAAACLTAAGDTAGLAQLDVVDAMLRLQAGEPGQCCDSAARGLARLPAGELWCTGSLHGMRALGLFLGGDIDAARTPACRALELPHQIGDATGTAFGLGTLAFIAAGEGRYERTAWLLGAAAPLWERTGRWYTGAPAFESLHQVAERVARAGLGDERFWGLRAAGAAAAPDEAVARALRGAHEDSARENSARDDRARDGRAREEGAPEDSGQP